MNKMTPAIIKESSRGFDRVEIEDEMFMDRKIFLTKPVDASSMDGFIRQLLYLNQSDPSKKITVYINSPGGEVGSGLAAYDLMHLIEAPVTTICIGEAASMAAILFLAGSERIMFPNSRIMIHDPSPAGGSLQGMKPDEVEEKLKDLQKMRDKLCSIIAEKTDKTMEEIRAKTCKDSYFSAQEALAFGLATKIAERIGNDE